MQVTATGAAPATDQTATTPPPHVTMGADGVARVDPSKRPDPAEGTTQGAQGSQSSERPSWLPEQFKTPEDLAKAYTELRKKMDSRQASGDTKPTGDQTTDPKAEITATSQTTQAAAQAVEQAGLDMAKLQQEIAETGTFSDESLRALKARGIDEKTAAIYVEGVKALAAQFRATLAESVGGEETLQAVTRWATENLTEDEAEAFNRALTSGDTAMAKMALAGIHARYVAAEGHEPQLLNGVGTKAATVEPFLDASQVTAAMRDPRYQTSEAYRAEVARRLAVSAVFHRR